MVQKLSEVQVQRNRETEYFYGWLCRTMIGKPKRCPNGNKLGKVCLSKFFLVSHRTFLSSGYNMDTSQMKVSYPFLRGR